MAVQVKLSGTKQISNTSLTSIVEFTNFNISQIVSSVQDFLKSINYLEGQDSVSVEISSIDADSVQIRQGLSVLGTQLNNGNLEEVIRLEPSGSIVGKNLLVNDVMQGLRLRLRVFGVVPPAGIPGEVIYVQDQEGYVEGFYGYLAGHGWVCLSCDQTSGGSGGDCCCNKENIVYTDAISTIGDAHEMPQTLSLGLEPALGTGFMLFVNGVQMEVGDGTTGAPVYLSDDGGLTAINFSEATTASQFYWNFSYSGFNLDSQDRLTLRYIAIDPYCNDITTTTAATTLPPVSTTQATTQPTTVPTTAVPTTNAPCAQDMIVAVQDPSSPTTRVTFTGNPTGPFQATFTDAYGQYHFLTSVTNITLPWVFDLSSPSYSSIPTVQGTYTFTNPQTGCQYIKTVGVPSISTTTAATTTVATTAPTTIQTTAPTTRCTCEYYTIDVREEDLQDAVGNSIGTDGQIWVSYYDCDGQLTDTIYEVSAEYASAICASTIAEPAIYYFKNDTVKVSTVSTVTATGVCCNPAQTTSGGPTTTACPCTFYTITIGSADLNAAISNTAYDNFSVYVSYLNCNNETVEKKYTEPGTFENDLCVRVNSVPLVTYFRNDSIRSVSASSATNTLVCCSQLVSTTVPTTAPTTAATTQQTTAQTTQQTTAPTTAQTTAATTQPTTTTTDPCLRATVVLNEIDPNLFELTIYGVDGLPFEVYQNGSVIGSGFTPNPLALPIYDFTPIWVLVNENCEYELIFNPGSGWRLSVAQTSTTAPTTEAPTTAQTTEAPTTAQTTAATTTPTTAQTTAQTTRPTTRPTTAPTTAPPTTQPPCNPDQVIFNPDGRGKFYLNLLGYPVGTFVAVAQEGSSVIAGPYPNEYIEPFALNTKIEAIVYVSTCEFTFVYDGEVRTFISQAAEPTTDATTAATTAPTTQATTAPTTAATTQSSSCDGKTAQMNLFEQPQTFVAEISGNDTEEAITIVQNNVELLSGTAAQVMAQPVVLSLDLPVTITFRTGCVFVLTYDAGLGYFPMPPMP